MKRSRSPSFSKSNQAAPFPLLSGMYQRRGSPETLTTSRPASAATSTKWKRPMPASATGGVRPKTNTSSPTRATKRKRSVRTAESFEPKGAPELPARAGERHRARGPARGYPERPMGPRRFLLLGFAGTSLACATPPPEPAPRAPEPAPRVEPAVPPAGPIYVPELVTAGLADPRAHALLSELCPLAPHRLAGPADAEKAVAWARETMLRLGLENVCLEPCLVPHWERGALEELVVVEPAVHAGERLPILALGGSVATPEGGLTAEVLAVRTFEE